MALVDPSVRHLRAIQGPASSTLEALYRAVALLPHTAVGRWGAITQWDFGISLGSTNGLDTRIAVWQDGSERAVVLTGDLYLGVREEVHSRLLWFEPLSPQVSFVSGGGVSNGKYPQFEANGVARLSERREGRVDVLLGVEVHQPSSRLVIAVNGYHVMSAGELRDFRVYPAEPTLSAPDAGVWISISVEALLGKPRE